MSTIDLIFKPEELREARTEALEEELKEVRGWAKRATSPAKRVAFSEMEQWLVRRRNELAQAGLINPQPEVVA